MHWIRREAQAAKALVGAHVGVPTEAHLLMLLEFHGIEVSFAPVGVSACIWTPQPRLLLPEGRRNRLAHEAGHALLDYPAAQLLRHIKPGDHRYERLARLAEMRGEWVASEWERCWLSDAESGDLCEGFHESAGGTRALAA